MNWIFENIGKIIFLIVAFSFAQKMKAALRRSEEEAKERQSARPATNFDPDEAERVRKIQEEIRRKIAERRGEATPAARESSLPERPPLLRPTEAPPRDPLNPLDSPMRRIFTEMERRMQERTEPQPAPVFTEKSPSQAAVLARQEELAEEYRVLQESRMLAERRAAQASVQRKNVADSEGGQLAASRGSLLAELHDPRNLRRAFVLREVLGPPVGLR